MTKFLTLLLALVSTLIIFNTGAIAKQNHVRYNHISRHCTITHCSTHNPHKLLPTAISRDTNIVSSDDKTIHWVTVISGRTSQVVEQHFVKSDIPGITVVTPTTTDRIIEQHYVKSDKPGITVETYNKHTVDTIRVASNYVGLNARTNRKDLIVLLNHTVDPVRVPWCTAFVNAILDKLGIHGTNSLMAGSFINWGTPTTEPKKNDIVLLSFNKRRGRVDHVGFYVDSVKLNGTNYVEVLGGNQSHSVKVSYFPAWQVVSYRTSS